MKIFGILSTFLLYLPNTLMSTPFTSTQECSIVFQPQFKWNDDSCREQGTGSFLKTSTGDLVGLTSAHFLNFSGPQLLKVEWLDVKTGAIIATSVKAWGMPGHEGSYDPLDLRSDYILMVLEGDIPSGSILELDHRNTLENGERIWFPNKNANSYLGYDLIEGSICEVQNTHLIVRLDQSIDLQSRSGTPIISQCTKKVIGILTGSNHNILYVAPSQPIYKACYEAQECPLLRDVIGQTK